jgi:hypothetical protein
MATLKVKSETLNLRKTAEIKDGNILASLPLAQTVEVITSNPTDRFWQVKTVLNGASLQGFVSAAFLRKPVSKAKEALISAAVTEWLRFDRGNKLEFEDPYYKYVGEYWSKINLKFNGLNRDQPWSAAFISFAARTAGYNDFKFAPAHSTYVYDAVDKRKANLTTAPFWGFEVNEHKPQLGDLVCRSRDGVVIDSMATLPKGGFISHCDIVVEIRDSEVRTLGGNVNQSVSITPYALDNNGFLKKANSVYGILRNNLS